MVESLPELQTERLVLKIAGPELAHQRLEYELRNRAFHEPWMPVRPPEFFTERFWFDRLEASQHAARNATRFNFTVLERRINGHIIGAVNFTDIIYGAFDACYLGYALDEKAVGRGYMTEALREGLRFIFEEIDLHRVMANYMPLNVRSGKLLHRLGFRIEGFARDYLRINGEWRDHILTALHADEFERANATCARPSTSSG